MAPKFVLFRVLFIAIYGCTLPSSLVSADNDVHVSASVPRVLEGITKDLTLTCGFRGDGTFFNVINSMILSKTGSPWSNSNYSDIASVESTQPQAVNVNNSLGAQVTGALVQGGDVNITYHWTYPPTAVTGKYLCQVFGNDQFGHPVQASGATHVDETEVGWEVILDKIRQMTITQDSLLSRLNTTEMELDKSRAAQNNTLLELEHMKVNQNNTIAELGKTTQDLNATKTVLSKTNQDLAATKAELGKTNQDLTATKAELGWMTQNLNATKAELDQMKAQRDNLKSALTVASTSYHNHDYIVSIPQWDSAQLANIQCQIFGGYLAEIDDQQEFDFLINFFKGNVPKGYSIYIGGSDHGSETKWTYINSGKPMTFFKWGATEPNDSSGGEDCVAINANYEMNDLLCQRPEQNRYVCEIPK